MKSLILTTKPPISRRHKYQYKNKGGKSCQQSLKEFTDALPPLVSRDSKKTKLHHFADNQLLNFNPSLPVIETILKTNNGKIASRLASRVILLQTNLNLALDKIKQLKLDKEKFFTKLRNQPYTKLTQKALDQHNQPTTSSWSSIISDDILSDVHNELLAMNIKKIDHIYINEYEKKTNDYYDIDENKQELRSQIENNTSQHTEIEQEHKVYVNENKQLLSELEHIRTELLKKENENYILLRENNKLKQEKEKYSTIVTNVRRSLAPKEFVDMKCDDNPDSIETKSIISAQKIDMVDPNKTETESIISELEKTPLRTNHESDNKSNSLSYIRMANYNSHIINALKTKLTEILCEVDCMGDRRLDLYSCGTIFGEAVEKDMEELFERLFEELNEELNEEKDASYDTVEIGIDNIINGIITSPDLT
eukprot:400345_1